MAEQHRRPDPDAVESGNTATQEERVSGGPQPTTGPGEVRTERPSFAKLKDDPLATAGTGGSEEPKGRQRPGLAANRTDNKAGG
ncbi:MAG: hypothetical protein IT178_08045 [Acidobacteria bacterium]|nr:hypothetical protein [Acidobacteriota bacterium]